MARGFFATREARLLLGGVVATSLLVQLITFTITLLTRTLVDDVFTREQLEPMTLISTGIALSLARAVIFRSRTIQLAKLQIWIDSRTMHSFMAHLLALPFGFFQQRGSGDLLSRLNSNTVIRAAVTNQTLSAILDGTMATMSLVALVALSPRLGLAAVSVALIQMVISIAFGRQLRVLSQRAVRARAYSNSYEVELMSGIQTLKATGADIQALQRWSGLFTRTLNEDFAQRRFSAVSDALTSSVNMLAPLALLWMSGWLVARHQLSLGDAFALNALAGSFVGPVASLVGNVQSLQQLSGYIDRLRMLSKRNQKPAGDDRPCRGAISRCAVCRSAMTRARRGC